jgi:hypothetical protein
MKISFPEDGWIKLEPENEGEVHQLDWVEKKLNERLVPNRPERQWNLLSIAIRMHIPTENYATLPKSI